MLIFKKIRDYVYRPIVNESSRVSERLEHLSSVLDENRKSDELDRTQLGQRLDHLSEKLDRTELYALATARRFALNCGHGEILIRSAVGYVLVDSGDHALISSLTESQELEPGLRLFLERTIRPKNNVVDVGANIGLHTITMARALKGDGSVYSFEPMPRTADLLEVNVKINGLSSLVRVRKTALSRNGGNRPLYLGHTSGHHSLFPLAELAIMDDSSIEVQVETLDSALTKVGRIDLIKIDAEGSELDVIFGGAKIIRQNKNILVIAEFGMSHLLRVNQSPEFWFSNFTSFGFSFGVINYLTGVVENWSMEKILASESVNLVFGRAGSKAWKKIESESHEF